MTLRDEAVVLTAGYLTHAASGVLLRGVEYLAIPAYRFAQVEAVVEAARRVLDSRYTAVGMELDGAVGVEWLDRLRTALAALDAKP